EARHKAQDASAEQPRTKRILGERKDREHDPEQRNEEPHPGERQQGRFAATFATPRHLAPATAAPVRCSNHDHYDTGGENHRFGDPRVHDRSARLRDGRAVPRWLPMSSTAANECPRRLSPTPWRADEVGFLGISLRWSLRPIENPASAGVWPNDVFSKITPRKSPRIDLSARPPSGLSSLPAIYETTSES